MIQQKWVLMFWQSKDLKSVNEKLQINQREILKQQET